MVVDKQGNGSPIEFRLDPTSGVPTYLQLVRQVEHALRLGYLVAGDQLAAGRPGQGTFIEGTLDVVPLRDQQALRRGLTRWLTAAADAGLDEEGITALFTSALHDLTRAHKGVIAS